MFFNGKYVMINTATLIIDWPQLIKDMGLRDDHELSADAVLDFLIKNKPKYAKVDSYFGGFGKETILFGIRDTKEHIWKNKGNKIFESLFTKR